MRIGMVCPYSFDVHGGVQAHVLQLAEVFLAGGHHVSVLAPSSADAGTDAARLRGVRRPRRARFPTTDPSHGCGSGPPPTARSRSGSSRANSTCCTCTSRTRRACPCWR